MTTILKGLSGAVLAGAVLIASPLRAEVAPPQLVGEYEKDPAACATPGSVVRITKRRLITEDVTCRTATFHRIAPTGQSANYKVDAKACIATGNTKGSPQVFRVTQRQDGSIRVHWADGTSTDRLVKCAGR